MFQNWEEMLLTWEEMLLNWEDMPLKQEGMLLKWQELLYNKRKSHCSKKSFDSKRNFSFSNEKTLGLEGENLEKIFKIHVVILSTWFFFKGGKRGGKVVLDEPQIEL